MYVHNEHQHSSSAFSLLDDRFELVYRANQSNVLERILPARLSKLWADINKLEDAIQEVRQVCPENGLIGF